MVGGDEEVVADLAPVFDAMGSLTVRMGPFGTGLAAKLARNLVQYGGWLAAYEGQVLAEAAGIELSKLAQVIRASDAKIGGAATLMFRSTVAQFTDDDDAGFVGGHAQRGGPGPQGPAGRTGTGRRTGRVPAVGGDDRGPHRRHLRRGRDEEER